MKIINKENGQDVVYVQKGDMMYVMHSCESFPAALMDEFFSDIVIINGDNRNEFVRFVDPSIVEFFRNQDWIIDYWAFKDLSEEEIMNAGRGVIDELNANAQTFNDSKDEDERARLYARHEALQYKFECVKEFLWYKQGHIKYSLPITKDGEEYKYVGDDKLNKQEKGIKGLFKRVFHKR